MKKIRKLEIEQHEEIAAWLTHPMKSKMSCLIPNTYGRSSKAGRLAFRLYNLVNDLKSEMENMAYKDGWKESATSIYYPQPKE